MAPIVLKPHENLTICAKPPITIASDPQANADGIVA